MNVRWLLIIAALLLPCAANAQSVSYNFTHANMAHWDSVKVVGDTVIAVVGESTAAGYPGTKAQSWPTLLGPLLAAGGIPAQTDSFFGDAALTWGPYTVYDPRVNGAGWSNLSLPPYETLGGDLFQGVTAGSPLVFTPGHSADTFDFFYLLNSAFTVNIDGGATLFTSPGTGPNSVAQGTVTATLGLHYLQIVPTSGTVYVVGAASHDSTHKTARIFSMPFGGATVAQWNQSALNWTTANAIAAIHADLSLVVLGINDAAQNTASGSFLSDLGATVTRLKTTGNVILVVEASVATSETPNEQQQLFRQLLYAFADQNSLPVIDLTMAQQFGTFAANPDGNGYYTDTAHMTAQGYAVQAKVIAQSILSAP